MDSWVTELEKLQRAGTPVAVVTVIGVSGSTPREVGAKMLVTADRLIGTIGGGRLEQLAAADARSCFATGKARTFRYPLGAKAGQCCGGVMDVLVEPMNAGPRLYLFGGGHVGQALCRVLEGTAFTIDLIEERPEWIDAPGLPASVRRHPVAWDEFTNDAEFDPARTYVAVMTFRHDLDQEIVAGLVRRPMRYFGLIGSRAKWHRFQQRLLARGFSEAELARVKCPIGLPIGGKAPKEVAVSVAAELISLHHAATEESKDHPVQPERRPQAGVEGSEST